MEKIEGLKELLKQLEEISDMSDEECAIYDKDVLPF